MSLARHPADDGLPEGVSETEEHAGVGVSVTNALSSWCEVEVRREGKVWQQRYEKGHPVTKVVEKGKTKERGTTVSFMADKTIFESIEFSFDVLSNRLRELAYLNKGVRITIRDERVKKEIKEHIFLYKGGISEFIQYLNPVGLGPSSKTWPRCEPQRAHSFSMRVSPRLLSSLSTTFFLNAG